VDTLEATPRARDLPRWAELVPLGILAAGSVALLVVTELNIVESTLGSGRAILIVIGIAIGWFLLSLVVLPRLFRARWPRVAILSAFALALVWLLVVPYFDDEEVHEVRAGFPTSEPARDAPSPASPAPAAPSAPVLVRSGSFVGDDHDASGTVHVFREADGGYVIQLLGIDIEGVPDPFVHFVPGTDRTDPDGTDDLGGLRANQGDLFYDVPAGVDPSSGDWTLLIWCRAFGVPIAHATLSVA
jgi:hypothetical protein